jgi:hypothetical protein
LQCPDRDEDDGLRESETLRSAASNCGEIENDSLSASRNGSAGVNPNNSLFNNVLQWFSGLFGEN